MVEMKREDFRQHLDGLQKDSTFTCEPVTDADINISSTTHNSFE